MLWPKKNSYKEFDNEKKIPAARKFPSPPPHNFSNGPSIRTERSKTIGSALGNFRNAFIKLKGIFST